MNWGYALHVFSLLLVLVSGERVMTNVTVVLQADRISGGQPAALGQFPYQAAVHHHTGGNGLSLCGGSLISSRWVITAAHCVIGGRRDYDVILGAINQFRPEPGSVVLKSREAVVHPQYRRSRNDIALIKLPRDVRFSATIKPIRLPIRELQRESYVGFLATTSGWGRTGPFYRRSNAMLNYVEVTVISNRDCSPPWNVLPSMICTKSIGKGDCQGDSGGPLALLSDCADPLLIGIVSFGDGLCPSYNPIVFTRVTAYIDWIAQVTGLNLH